jgi:phosphomannomutase
VSTPGPAWADAAAAWRAVDPDPATRAEVDRLVAAGDVAGLAERFGGRLQFGTAGLRGELGAGPNRMNRALVRLAASGLARYLGPGRRVVIGFDARHMSGRFALDSAAVMSAAGLDAMVFERPVPTPVLAFAVTHLACDAGVMVTASHNPARDNGYKVYLGDGAQIVPPADREISAAIDAVRAPVPLAEGFATVGDDVVDAYLAAIAGAAAPGLRALRIVYTPVHGVGGRVALAAFRQAGFVDVHVVARQAEPDPDFPTAPFPNPEEPGVLDLALALADEVGADVVLANDPDADRLAVAVGGRRLTGDEVGCLLAEDLLARPGDGHERLVVTSVVSSTLLGRVAADAGAHYERTLTGFKWVVRPALAHPEWDAVLGYEESLGYAVGRAVRDKDGISAALAVASLAARAKAEGATLLDRLAALDRRYGRYRTGQRSFRIPVAEQQEVMARVHTVPGAVELGPGVVRVGLADGWAVFRPSGTEPKLKLYAEVVDGDLEHALASAAGWAGLA